MSERRKQLENEINAIAVDVARLEGRLLDLTARIAKEDWLSVSWLIPVVGQLDQVRRMLTKVNPGLDPDDRIGQQEQPPIPPGDDMAPPHRRHRGRRP